MVEQDYTLIGLGVLVVSNMGLWIDKVYVGKRKLKVSGQNGESLKALHIKVDSLVQTLVSMNTTMAVASNEMLNMKAHCQRTIDRYDKKFDKIDEQMSEIDSGSTRR